MKLSQESPEFQAITIVCETMAEWKEVSAAVLERTHHCYQHTVQADIRQEFLHMEQKQ